MSRPALSGRCIAVTRPAAQCASLAAAIERRGGEALVVPLIEIVPIADSDEIRAVRSKLGDFQLAFFVSPNAVVHGLAALGGKADWPAGLAVAGVGAGTRRALEAQGFGHVVVPTEGADSEAVLALPEFSAAALAGRRLLIVRGDGGRDLLGAEAARRGAEVSYLACYRRRPPRQGVGALLEAARNGRLDALTVTSSEALDNLERLIGAAGIAALAALPLFAPHPRIAERAGHLGFTTIATTAAGDDGMLAGLDAHFGSLG